MSVLITIVAITFMLAMNALYVAAEFATVGARKSRVQSMGLSGNGAAQRLFEIVKDPVALDNYVATCQVGITLSSLVAGAFGQARLTPLFEPAFGAIGGRAAAVVLTLLIITSLQVILGELLPKTAALRYPERLAVGTLKPMLLSQLLFKPLVKIFNGSAFTLMRWVGLSTEHSHAHVHSPEELATLFDESAAGGLIDADERDMVAGVLNVERRTVRDIMTPRRRLVGIPADQKAGPSLEAVVETPHTRFPVWGDMADDAVGMVALRDLYLCAQADPGASVAGLAQPVLEVAETMSVPEFWRRLDADERHCALVINEYGGVVGLVTLEDAIEEVFGEVHDEFDTDPDPIVVSGGRASVAGEVLLEDLDQRFDLDLDTADADTIGGLLWLQLGHLPDEGEMVELGGDDPLVVRVDTIDGNALARVSFDVPGADQ